MRKNVTDWQEYWEKHKYCPSCGSVVCSTFAGISGYRAVGDKDDHLSTCDCGWQGIVDDRTQKPIKAHA